MDEQIEPLAAGFLEPAKTATRAITRAVNDGQPGETAVLFDRWSIHDGKGKTFHASFVFIGSHGVSGLLFPSGNVDANPSIIEICHIETARTKTGLTVQANIIKKVYETGRKYSEILKKTMRIAFGEKLSKLNWRAILQKYEPRQDRANHQGWRRWGKTQHP